MQTKPNPKTFQQWHYWLKHQIFNRQNLILLGAAIIALSWIWSAIGAMSQNYQAQKKLDTKLHQQQILELETLNLEYEQKYYQSREYQELALRQKTNLAAPGEKVLIMGEYSNWVKQKEAETNTKTVSNEVAPSNFRQWLNFLLGGRSQTIR